MHPIEPKGFSMGLDFQFFEYLGMGLGLDFFKSFANFKLDNSKYKKKNLIFGYGFEYKFRKTRKKIKIDTQIHTQKIKIFFCI
jgi:hypothetical protein